MVQSGDVLAGKYRVERVLGKGGMGYVVSAIHLQLEERVAIKLLMPELCVQDEPVARFLREARAAVRIRSEHVARVLDVGVLDDGAPYMVMEYLEGNDLSAELDRRMQLGLLEAVEYVLQACEAIAEAHARGIVHRDLKPANLFLTRRADGSPLIKVLDFGISKAIVPDNAEPMASLTATQSLLGSPNYMSPEQVRKPKSVDARTDIWSLGVILYELLTGSLPFTAENAMSVLAAVVSDPTPRLRETRAEAPEGLEQVVSRCLSKEPTQRYADVAELAEALLPFAPPSAAPSVRRISGVLRSGGEGSHPPGESGARSPKPVARTKSAEEQTLVSESDRAGTAENAPSSVATDPTLRADFAPRAASSAGAARNGETASQWEHSKEPTEKPAARGQGAWFIGIGLLGAVAAGGYWLSTLKVPEATPDARDAHSGIAAPSQASPVASEWPAIAPSAAAADAEPATVEDAAALSSAAPAHVPASRDRREPARTGKRAEHPVASAAASAPRSEAPLAPSPSAGHPVDPLEGRR